MLRLVTLQHPSHSLCQKCKGTMQEGQVGASLNLYEYGLYAITTGVLIAAHVAEALARGYDVTVVASAPNYELYDWADQVSSTYFCALVKQSQGQCAV
jgi:hypothetical protein